MKAKATAAMSMSPASSPAYANTTPASKKVRQKFSGESFHHSDHSDDAGTPNIGVTVTKPETPSPPSSRQQQTTSGTLPYYAPVWGPTTIGIGLHHPTQTLRSTPSVTFANQPIQSDQDSSGHARHWASNNLQWRLRYTMRISFYQV